MLDLEEADMALASSMFFEINGRGGERGTGGAHQFELNAVVLILFGSSGIKTLEKKLLLNPKNVSFLFRKRASSRCLGVLYPIPKSKPQLGNLIKPQKSEIPRVLDHGSSSFSPKTSRTLSGSIQNIKNSIGSGESFGLSSNLGGIATCGWVRFCGNQAAQEPMTSDGLTVDRILNSEWPIHTEDESDWKSHAASVAQSIHRIKKRLQWKKLMVWLDMLSVELIKPNFWDDRAHAGKISREHGSLMGKMKEVKLFEQELLEHVDMIKLAREENGAELESVGSQYFS